MIYIVEFNSRNRYNSSLYSIVIGQPEDQYGDPIDVLPTDDERFDEGTDYVYLEGASSTFTWDMDDSEDILTAIRTHSGYIRIMDTGEDSDGEPFDWRTLVPSGSTDIPFTLWESSNGVQPSIVYRGYLVPDNFSSGIVSYPVVREFPVCCGLETLSDLKFSPTGSSEYFVTFAEILYQIFSSLGFSPEYIFMPGTKVVSWLGLLSNLD